MRIAYIGIKGLPAKAGADRVVEALIQRLAERHYITVYCVRDSSSKAYPLPGVRLVGVPTLPFKYVRPVVLFLLSSLHAVLFGQYDLVHLHNVEASFVLPLLRLKYRVVSTAHGFMGRPGQVLLGKWGPLTRRLWSLMEYPFMLLSSYRTSVSLRNANYAHERYGRQVHFIPNGVDIAPPVNENKARATLSAHGLDYGNYILFAAARIDPVKGCHFLLQAFGGLPCDCKLAVVGDLGQVPAYGLELRAMADARVRFIPLISARDELFGMLRGCRIFVFPSSNESMSMVLLEAASLSVPIVCSDIPENRFLSDHVLFFESENVQSLKATLEWALNHRKETCELAAGAQAWVRKNYPWEKIAEKYDSVYSIVARSRCPAGTA